MMAGSLLLYGFMPKQDDGRKRFEAEIAAIIEKHKRKIARMTSVQRGESLYERIKVKEYKVSGYTVRSHWRFIVTKKK